MFKKPPYIRPICLPLSSESSTLGEKLYVAGWGKTERANRSPVKLKLEVPIAERSHCVSSFRRASISLKDTQLCAGGVKAKIHVQRWTTDENYKNDTSQWYIEGIVSFGAGCGTEGWPGIYTRVSKYLEWIRNTIKS
ncbi:hypothetical protein NQ317_002494 [Molorchus minor]|uniref:Peptidase S1 domain-containing protein n=1 Tax=Molorchus minor TaxID=1323400 RepID=A0ABQ9JB29_9CUCU|nr:hypothetical protein NQ317_002494 [Molorchus minor]